MTLDLKHPVRTSLVSQALEPVSPPSLSKATNFHALERHTGFFDRRRANRVGSRAASGLLADLKTAVVQADYEVALTVLSIAKTKIKTALVSSSIMQIGPLTIDLNAKTAAVHERLTSANSGELVTHLQNRAASVASIKSMERDERVSADEATALIAFADADAVDDINRSRERNRKAKDAVEALHNFALDGIARAKDNI